MECPPPRFKSNSSAGAEGLAACFGRGRRRAALDFSSARRGVRDRFGLRHGFEGLLRSHQDRRVIVRQCSRRRRRQSNCCGGLVGRKFREKDHVVLSEGEEDLVELSARLLDRPPYGLLTGIRVVDERLGGCRGIADLDQKVRHAKSSLQRRLQVGELRRDPPAGFRQFFLMQEARF